ncbi:MULTISPECIES: hypothetical protein [unclassified Sphingomonas]|uniref:hypothetical protein n=1 Tax=unclassified Sphingomonas TaxID=196159 RepID=UPI0006FA3AFC|nr:MULTISPECIES: hypothetical protein [unclassified Sphingomonas]KQN13812.1 hypothetical protein ASE81_05405 [Sphingomonas sp. Leaf29]
MTPADGGAAFPSVCLDDPGHPASMPGMSLRDWFAGQALTGIVCDPKIATETNARFIPELAYALADAMLRERAK